MARGPLVVQFTDPRIENRDVLRVFLDLLMGTPELDSGLYTETLLRLARFLEKWDCPDVMIKLGAGVERAFASSAMTPESACAIAAALGDLSLCEDIVKLAGKMLILPWRSGYLPASWERSIDPAYHDALLWRRDEHRTSTVHRPPPPYDVRMLAFQDLGRSLRLRRQPTPPELAQCFRYRVERAQARQTTARRLLHWIQDTAAIELDEPEVPRLDA
ncbi:hypothetical protein A1Q2_00773 [Trichosporon asahii var. asahii CBS 8904]|uniref:Uncharacterized protein n=1 Tax=Trichosporon asahii var. asahii (strain CBS 8904) TaxID=1220162 RepID=K1VZB2_TRIAC|nr:hypothetical protein A1Q2_00773 [Trichosporon asahii var. asahii CBS 8904]